VITERSKSRLGAVGRGGLRAPEVIPGVEGGSRVEDAWPAAVNDDNADDAEAGRSI
jgi:hypothetical protein